MFNKIFLLFLLISLSFNSAEAYYLTFPQIQELAKPLEENSPVKKKLEEILNRVEISNKFNTLFIKREKNLDKQYLRVSHWNIERGFYIKAIKEFYTNSDSYFTNFVNSGLKNRSKEEDFDDDDYLNAQKKVKDEIEVFKDTDILLLNEVDIGMPRTDYKNITAELADFMKMNYAFAPEFIEVDPSVLNNPDLKKEKLKALHGNAILSKYPIESARVVRLHDCYDWFNEEREETHLVEKFRRRSSRLAFQEMIITELRRGGRIALIADIRLPNDDMLTAVSTHLENRASPSCREKQMQDILDEIKDIKHAVVLGGDLNNFEASAEPTSIKRIIGKRLKDPHFLGKVALNILNPFEIVTNTAGFVVSSFREYRDPLVTGMPIVMPNRSKGLFKKIRKFEFDDTRQFDFLGDEDLSFNEREDTLSNSNQRAFKGFVETFQFRRNFGITKYKIDWLFVKPIYKEVVEKKYYPAFGRTLKALNYSYSEEAEEDVKMKSLSDHNPITLELVF